MTKLEKVIRLIEEEIGVCELVNQSYRAIDLPVLRDILALLKEREAQPAIIEGSDVIRIGRCPTCKTVLQPWGANHCYNCGQAVKWDD